MSYRIMKNCIGCTLCVKHCPVAAISGIVKEPHEIIKERCIDCGICANYCKNECIINPKGEIKKNIPSEDSIAANKKIPIIDKAECTACSICVDICIFNCIKIAEPTFKGDINVAAEIVNLEKCESCNLCAEYCPMEAITLKGGD